MKKRIFVMSLCMTLLISIPFASMAADKEGLKDLNGHWSEGQVAKAVETGWVNGYPDGTFRPEATITRAEFTKMALAADRLIPGSENALIYENDFYQYAYHDPEGRYGEETFEGAFDEKLQKPLSDMADHWLTKQGWATIALNYGMLVSEDYAHAGYRFSPDKPITRYEMTIMMDRMLGLVNPANENHKDESTGFADDKSMKDWQRGYVIEAFNAGVLQGYPDGSFHGERTATRAEAVTMVQNALDYMEEGIDEGITLKSTNHPLYQFHKDYSGKVSCATVQIIDGRIYVPLDRCYISCRECSDFKQYDDGLKSRSHKVDYQLIQWAPIHQGLEVNQNLDSKMFLAGTKNRAEGSSGKLFFTHKVEGSYWTMDTAPRMLYGHLMVGLKPVKKTEETKNNQFPVQTVFWEPNSKIAEIYIERIYLPFS